MNFASSIPSGSGTMASLVNQSSTRLRPLAAVSLLASALLAPNSVIAEIVVDDFDDAAQVVEVSTGAGEMPFKPVVTEQVGELNATREMLIYARLTNPVWSFDSSVSTPSLASAQLDGHTRTNPDGNRPVIEFDLRYDFSPMDLTEQGTNNAFLFDFASHQGTEAPLFLRITALGASASESYAAFTFNLPFSQTPFAAVMPFGDFTFRGGGPATPDFSTLHRFLIDFFFLAPSEDIQWSAQLDRIRIGRVPIPESNSIWLAMVGVLVLVCGRVRKRYRPHPNGGSYDAKNTYFRSAGFVARRITCVVGIWHRRD